MTGLRKRSTSPGKGQEKMKSNLSEEQELMFYSRKLLRENRARALDRDQPGRDRAGTAARKLLGRKDKK